jgi:pimeloyl-ACP methyl ester carboxylesterase
MAVRASTIICFGLFALGGLGRFESMTACARRATYADVNNGRSSRGINPVFIDAAGTRLHYVDVGRGKQTVVLIHGNAGYLQDFEFGTIGLLSNRFRAIAFDRPGHGLSELPKGGPVTVEDQAVILHEALDVLGVKEPIVVGHSWGAAVALAYGLKYPHETAGLVLLSPVAYSGAGHDCVFSAILRTPILGDISLVLAKPFIARRMLAASLKEAFYPDAVPEEYKHSAEKVWLGRRQLKAFAQDDLTLDDSLRRLSIRYREITAPAVIVTGDQDHIVPPDQNALRLHRALINSELVIIRNAGHQIPQIHPEEILRAVERIVTTAAPHSCPGCVG